jgi:hypothetical protein
MAETHVALGCGTAATGLIVGIRPDFTYRSDDNTDRMNVAACCRE